MGKKQKKKKLKESKEDNEYNEEDEKIFKLFGFKNFSSSKNKSHIDSDMSGAFFGKYVKRIYSQYMNKGINPKKRLAISQQNNPQTVTNNLAQIQNTNK
jgi:hypothetical protein